MQVLQMVTLQGGVTMPVEVQLPLTVKNILIAASKKFKAVTKQGRVYHSITGAELSDAMPLPDLTGASIVLSGKGGWKGAACLASNAALAGYPVNTTTETICDGPATLELDGKEQEGKDAREITAPISLANPEQLFEAAKVSRTTGVVLCWKETQDNGYLSNWAKSWMVIDGVKYSCVEQWLMALKARSCGDEHVLGQIMKAVSPRKQKGLGRSLDKKQVDKFWREQQKWAAQLRGVRAKFKQNEGLALKLLRTGQKHIAEASPSDVIFGIGLAPSDPLAQDPLNWKGKNILGKCLMQARDEIRQHLLAGGQLGDFHEELSAAEAEETTAADVAREAGEESSNADSGSALESEEEGET